MKILICTLISLTCLTTSAQTSAPRSEALSRELNGMFRSAVLDTSNYITADKYGGIRWQAPNFTRTLNIGDMETMIATYEGITFTCKSGNKCIKTLRNGTTSASGQLTIQLTGKDLADRIIENLKELQERL